MIKTLLLILRPVETWEKIFRARKGPLFIFGTFLLPLLLIGCVAQGYGLVHWGKQQHHFSRIVHFSTGQAVVFEVMQFIALLALVIFNAAFLRSMTGTFFERHTFAQGFRTIAYGFGPLLLLRCLDAFKDVSPWVSWAIGILLVFKVLYQGIPKIMEPDPAHAFGLYLVTCCVLLLTTGILQLATVESFAGNLPRLMDFISGLGARLPF